MGGIAHKNNISTEQNDGNFSSGIITFLLSPMKSQSIMYERKIAQQIFISEASQCGINLN